MKRRNVDYEYETNREKVVNVDFEQLMREFNEQSKDKKHDRGNRKKRKHKK